MRTRNPSLLQITHHGGTFKELRAAGAPPEGPVYRDPDLAASALGAVAPIGVTLHRREQLPLDGKGAESNG